MPSPEPPNRLVQLVETRIRLRRAEISLYSSLLCVLALLTALVITSNHLKEVKREASEAVATNIEIAAEREALRQLAQDANLIPR